MVAPLVPKRNKPQAKAFLQGLPNYSVSETVAEIKHRFQLEEVVYLASNENPFGCSPGVGKALNTALEDSHRYPEGTGQELKTALASALQLSPGQVLLGNGSNEILDCVIKAFLGPGDELMVSAHSFAMYPIMAQWVGAEVRQIPMQQWVVDLDSMAASVTSKTRLILLANANNPTGTMVSAAQMEAFLSAIPADILVLVDEAYIEFAASDFGHAVSLMSRYSNLVVCRTFSKAYGLAGLRIGYGLGDPEIISVLETIQQPFNVNTLALKAAVAAFDDQTFLQRCIESNREQRERLESFLTDQGLSCLPSQTNFIAFELDGFANDAYQALLQQGVIVRRLSGYDMNHWLRVSIGTADENSRFILGLKTFLEDRYAG